MKLKCNSCSKANAFFGLYCLVKTAKHHSPFTLYAISRSPIVHPVCPHPQRFCITFVIHLPSLLQSSQEKLKPCLCNFFCGGWGQGGQTRCIMGDVQVASTSQCYNKICKLGFHISVFIGGKCSITFLKAKQASFGGRFQSNKNGFPEQKKNRCWTNTIRRPDQFTVCS